MDTSRVQLKNRYKPVQPISRSGNTWRFLSERHGGVYTTTRKGSVYTCDCPARGLCKHIQSAILDDARKRFKIVQVWTSENDARRQHRRMFRIRANRQTVWVTVGAERDRVAELDAEIRRLGELVAAARHRWYMASWGPQKAAAQLEIEQLMPQLLALQYEREREVVRRMALT